MTDAELAKIRNRHIIDDRVDWDSAGEKARDHMDRGMLLAEVRRLRAIEKVAVVVLKAWENTEQEIDLAGPLYSSIIQLRTATERSKT